MKSYSKICLTRPV